MGSQNLLRLEIQKNPAKTKQSQTDTPLLEGPMIFRHFIKTYGDIRFNTVYKMDDWMNTSR